MPRKECGRVLQYNPWNQSAEPGDIMVTHTGQAFRLYERTGGPQAAAGVLCMRELKKGQGRFAKIVNGKLVWE